MSRLLEINTPLGEGVIELRHLSGRETLGALPEFQLSLVARRGDIKPSEILGKNITIGIELPGGRHLRYLNGFITRFTDAGHTSASYFQEGTQGRAYLYEATLHSSLWFLTRAANCRIFQNKKVPDIIKTVLEAYPFLKFKQDKLTATYREWEYCCQYRETDFNFVSRLMEQEGIYYYFEHENGQHTLVLCDAPTAHQPQSGYKDIPYLESTDAVAVEDEYIREWQVSHEIQPGRYSLNDFQFTTPNADMLNKVANAEDHDLSNFEYFDYPGEYDKAAEGKHYATVRLQELHAQYEVFAGSGSVRGIQAGYLFNLTDHPRAQMNKEFLLTSVSYKISNNSLGSGGEAADYQCQFQAIAAKVNFRTARCATKPVVQGPQTALVVGPEGEEICTDKYGRVKVQFHWDRYSEANEKSSCWVRVAQPLAGKGWGAMFIPRIGNEVVVEFLEGDPDRPLITGSVYNADSMPSWSAEESKTQSGFKTRTYKGGNSNFNELRFEDKKGSEHVYLHAERDQVLRSKNNRIEWVGNESHAIVKKDVFQEFGADHHYALTGDQNNQIDGTVSLKIGEDWQAKVANKLGIDAGKEIHLKASSNVVIEASNNVAIKASAGVVIEAGTQLTLKVGGNFVTIDASGVSIKGTLVNINSGGSPGSPASGAGASPQAPKKPLEAMTSQGGGQSKPKKPSKPKSYSPQAKALKLAAKRGSALV